MKKSATILLIMLVNLAVFAQSYNEEKISLTNFLKRMYQSAPFEGVKVVDDYNNAYLISVLALDSSKYENVNAAQRVASVKAIAQASKYLNGANISTDMIIKKSEKSDSTTQIEIIENIKENSIGYVKALEQLTNFIDQKGNIVFIFCKKIADIQPKQQIDSKKKKKKNRQRQTNDDL